MIEIVVNNTILDLSSDLNIPFTKLFDTEDFGKIAGGGSNISVLLPATSNNNLALGFPYLSEQRCFDVKIFRNSVTIFNGKMTIDEIELYDKHYSNEPKNYKVSFQGNSKVWIDLLSDTDISKLDWDFITLNNTTLEGSFNNFSATTGTPFDSTPLQTAFTLTKRRVWDLIDPNADYVFIDQFTPIFFIRDVIYKSLTDLGYKIESPFFESNFGKRLVCPYNFLKRRKDWKERNYVLVGQVFNSVPVSLLPNPTVFLSTPYEVNDLNNHYTTGYTVTETGRYEIKSVGKITSGSVGGGLFLVGFRRVNGGAWFSYGQSNVTLNALEFIPFEAGGTTSFFLNLNAGDFVEFGYTVAFTSAGNYNFEVQVEVNPILEYVENDIVNPQDCVPQYKMVDILKGMIHAFDLIIETDESTKTVTIDTRINYVGGEVEDLGTFIDLNSKSRVITAKNESFILNYPTDSTDETSTTVGETWGDVTVTSTKGCVTQEPKEDLNPFFSKTLMYYDNKLRFQSIAPTPNQRVYIPLIYGADIVKGDDLEEIADHAPRLLYFAGVLNANHLVNTKMYPATSTTTTFIPFGYSFVIDMLNFTNINLNYSDVTLNGTTYLGLVNGYKFLKLNEKLNADTLETFTFMNEYQLKALKSNKIYHIFGKNYRLKSLVYDFNKRAKLTLKRILYDRLINTVKTTINEFL